MRVFKCSKVYENVKPNSQAEWLSLQSKFNTFHDQKNNHRITR